MMLMKYWRTSDIWDKPDTSIATVVPDLVIGDQKTGLRFSISASKVKFSGYTKRCFCKSG
jgi:hypothetical protein